jgi:membrane fusion protein (multidrug efflux system)
MAEADLNMRTEHEASEQPIANETRRGLGKSLRLLAMVSVPLLIVAGGVTYWITQQGKVTTDNAYVHQDKVSVSAEVGGPITDVFVKENQHVDAGQLLFRIDPQPFQLHIQQADAALASAQVNVTTLSHDTALSGADIAAAREDIAFAEATFARQRALWNRGFTTKADYDAARHAVEQARASLRAAQASQSEAQAKLATGSAVPGVNPQIAVAKAQRATAELDLKRTEVRAPTSGIVAEADRLQKGQLAMTGLPVITLVKSDASYVEANFKETDLKDMRVGQRAEIRLDAYPDAPLKGHVSSIGAGTGSEFSVLPAQNATGNWVKVTQRVPVRIAIDGKSPRQLIAGLSAHITVFTRNKGQ